MWTAQGLEQRSVPASRQIVLDRLGDESAQVVLDPVNALDQVRSIDDRRLLQGPLSRLQPQQLDVIAHALLEVLDLPGA